MNGTCFKKKILVSCMPTLLYLPCYTYPAIPTLLYLPCYTYPAIPSLLYLPCYTYLPIREFYLFFLWSISPMLYDNNYVSRVGT